MGQSIPHNAFNASVANRGRGHLLRILGAGFGIAVGVGNMIGTGILRTPGEIAGYLGSAWMFIVAWLLGGIYTRWNSRVSFVSLCIREHRSCSDTLIAIGSVLFVAVYVSGFAALLVLRKREPLLTRPYRVWWYPWSTVGVLLASGAFLCGAVIGDLKHSLFTVILVLLSYLVSILMARNAMRSNAGL